MILLNIEQKFDSKKIRRKSALSNLLMLHKEFFARLSLNEFRFKKVDSATAWHSMVSINHIRKKNCS